MLRSFIYIFLFCCSYIIGYTQTKTSSIHFVNYSIKDGLPDNTINGMLEDSRGFIWLATPQGLVRFDGSHFVTYCHLRNDNNTMPFDNIRSCFELQDGIIMLLSGSNIWMMNTLNQRQFAPPSFWKNKTITSIEQPYSNVFCVATHQKIYLADRALNAFDSIPVAAMMGRILALGNNSIVLDYSSQFVRYSLSDRKLEKLILKSPNVNSDMYKSLIDTDTTQKKLYLYNYFTGPYVLSYAPESETYLKPVQLTNYELHGWVKGFHHDGRTDFVMTEKGLSILAEGHKQMVHTHDVLNNQSIAKGAIYGMYADREEGYWIWGEGGLSYFKLKNLHYDYWDIPFGNNMSVSNFLEVDHKLFFSMESLGVASIDMASGKFSIIDTLCLKNCSGIEPLNHSICFYGTGKYHNQRSGPLLSNFDTERKTISTPSFLNPFCHDADYVTFVYQSKQGDIWYSLNKGQGIIRQRAKDHVFIQYTKSSTPSICSFGYVQNAVEDQKGTIYFSASRRSNLLVWNHEKEIFSEWKLDSLLHIHRNSVGGILALCKDHEENIWISIEQEGLIKYNLNSKTGIQYGIEDGLPSNIILSMCTDAKNNLWFTTPKGLTCYVASSRKFVTYTERDGLPFTDFTKSNVYINSKDTTIYFDGAGKIYQLKTEELLSTSFSLLPRVFIDAMWVNSSPFYFNDKQEFKLQHDDNNIRFSFVMQSKVNQRSNSYEYKLLYNGNGAWQQLHDNNIIAFANLKPGQYVLYVRGIHPATNRIIEGENCIYFSIAEYWYATWWFKLLMILVLIAFIIFLLWYYFNEKLKRQQALFYERSRIAGEMHDDLGLGLTKIRYLSEDLKNTVNQNKQQHQVGKIIEHSNDLIDNLNDIIWTLQENEESLEDFIYRLKSQSAEMLEKTAIELVAQLPENMKDMKIRHQVRRHIYLIVKEFIHNTIKYAEATNVKWLIELDEYQLKLSLADNGKGFDIEAQKASGNGLSNFEKRTKQIGGRVSIESNQYGTRAVFIFPLETIIKKS